jgi:hypothetical protein
VLVLVGPDRGVGLVGSDDVLVGPAIEVLVLVGPDRGIGLVGPDVTVGPAIEVLVLVGPDVGEALIPVGPDIVPVKPDSEVGLVGPEEVNFADPNGATVPLGPDTGVGPTWDNW